LELGKREFVVVVVAVVFLLGIFEFPFVSRDELREGCLLEKEIAIGEEQTIGLLGLCD